MGGMCMAKQTFLNLPEEKKNNIINALKKEFSRVPLKDALVSNIIIDAKIPRGSFYQYFDNIEDFNNVIPFVFDNISIKLNNIKEDAKQLVFLRD